MVESTLTLPSGGPGYGYLRNIQAAALDEAGGLAYFAVMRPLYGGDCGVIRLDLNTETWSPYVQTDFSSGIPGTELLLDVPHNYGYVSKGSLSNLSRFTLSPFAYVDTLSGFPFFLHTHAIDIANQRAYVCPYNSTSWVYRINLTTFSIIDYITLPAGEGYPWRTLIDTSAGYLYVLTAETPKITRIRLSTFSRIDAFPVDLVGPFIDNFPYAIMCGSVSVGLVGLLGWFGWFDWVD